MPSPAPAASATCSNLTICCNYSATNLPRGGCRTGARPAGVDGAVATSKRLWPSFGGARFTPFIEGVSYWIDAKKLTGTIDTTGTKFPLVLSWNGKPWEPLTRRDFAVEKILPGKEGILSISLFTKWVYADAKGNLLADRPFDNVWFFGDSVPGHGKVSIDGKVCWLDRTGKLVWDGRKITKYDPDAGKLLP